MFHAGGNNEPRAGQWLYLPVYALKRLPVTLRLLRPFLRHPLLTLRNLRFLAVRDRDPFPGECFGVSSRAEFIARVARQVADWRAGRVSVKPQVWIFQAYCEKPMRCACGPDPDSPYREPAGQRRFNEGCVLADREGRSRCGAAGTCRVGRMVTRWEGDGRGLDIRVKVMLNERQMADFWEEMMEHQARTGQLIPWVMDVCPMALWLARCSLFQLKIPVGVVFLFESPNRCRTWAEYRAADKGDKQATEPVALSGPANLLKEEFLQQLSAVDPD